MNNKTMGWLTAFSLALATLTFLAAPASAAVTCSGTLTLTGVPQGANSAFVQFPDNGVPDPMLLTDSSGFSQEATQPQGAGNGVNALDEDSPFGPLVLTFDQAGTLTLGTVFYGFPNGSTQGPASVNNVAVTCTGSTTNPTTTTNPPTTTTAGPQTCQGTLTLTGVPQGANSAFVQFPDSGVPTGMLLTDSSGFSQEATQPQGAGNGVNALDEDSPFGPLVLTFNQAGTLTLGTVFYGFPNGSTQGPASVNNVAVTCTGSTTNPTTTTNPPTTTTAGPQTCQGTLTLTGVPQGANSAFVQFTDNGVPDPMLLTASSGFSQPATQPDGAGSGINALDEDQPFGPLSLTFDRAGTLTLGTVAYGFPSGSVSDPVSTNNVVVTCTSGTTGPTTTTTVPPTTTTNPPTTTTTAPTTTSSGPQTCSGTVFVTGVPEGANSAFLQYAEGDVPNPMVLTGSSGFSQPAGQVGGAGGAINALDEDQPFGPLTLTFNMAGVLTPGQITYGFPNGDIQGPFAVTGMTVICTGGSTTTPPTTTTAPTTTSHTTTPHPTTTTPPPPVVPIFDVNDDCMISLTEAIAAVEAFYDGTISLTQLQQVINAFYLPFYCVL